MALHPFFFRSHLPAGARRVFAWHENPGAFERLSPPWQRVRLLAHEGIGDGRRAVLRLYVGPFYRTWIAEHVDCLPGRQFGDFQVRGPFGSWTHVHRMVDDGPDACFLEDDIRYALPVDRLSWPVFGELARRSLERLFRYRHRVTERDLDVLRRLGSRKLRIAVSGSAGAIGRRVCAFLSAGGHEVIRLVRTEDRRREDGVLWDPTTGRFEAERLSDLDAVIHLAGEPIVRFRWSLDDMQAFRSSRVGGTHLLAEGLASLAKPPRVLISASGVGYYGDRGPEVVRESDPAGSGTLSRLVTDWEAATAPAAAAGIRVVSARLGAVLTPEAGILGRLLPWFRAGLGAAPSRIDPFVSWIGPEDVIGALCHILGDENLSGPVNLVSPEPVTLDTFTGTLARLLRRPRALRIPEALLRAALGAVWHEMVSPSIRAEPAELRSSGYSFFQPRLEEALGHVLGLR